MLLTRPRLPAPVCVSASGQKKLWKNNTQVCTTYYSERERGGGGAGGATIRMAILHGGNIKL